MAKSRTRPRSAPPGAAAVNGLTVYVPPAYTREGVAAGIDPEASQKLNQADVAWGVASARVSEGCRHELNAGIALGKNMIVMSAPALARRLQPAFGPNLVVIDPENPDQAEIGIVRYLKAVKGKK
jgi:hypothetical protein